MHGAITVTSEVGRGTTFTFEVPLVPAADAAPTTPAQAPQHGVAAVAAAPARDDQSLPYRGVHVLSADDNEIIREVLAQALARLGAEVTSVETGAAALAAVTSQPFDIVFMDASMPEMDGFEAATRSALGVGDGRAAIPIVALTAHAFDQKGETWRRAGMSDFVPKPFTLELIGDCLKRCLPAAGSIKTTAATVAHLDTLPLSHDAPPPALLDPAVLDAVAQIAIPGRNLVERVTALYVEHAPRLLQSLLDVRRSDVQAIASAAHALKSVSCNVGASTRRQSLRRDRARCRRGLVAVRRHARPTGSSRRRHDRSAVHQAEEGCITFRSAALRGLLHLLHARLRLQPAALAGQRLQAVGLPVAGDGALGEALPGVGPVAQRIAVPGRR